MRSRPGRGGGIAGYFEFAERGTNFATEARAGLTTFMVMVYIVFLNASILGDGFGLAADGTPLPAGSEGGSELIQQPLIGGGYAHAGIHMFADGSPEQTTLLRWLQGTTLATCTTRN